MNIPTSPQQNRLIHHIRLRYPTERIILNYPVKIRGKGYRRYPDVGWPRLKLGFEYDGVKYHRTKGRRENDAYRDAELKAEGWWIIHVTARNWDRFFRLLPIIVRKRESAVLGKSLNSQILKGKAA